MSKALKNCLGELHIKVMFISDPNDDDGYAVAKQSIITEQLLEYAVLPAEEMAVEIFKTLFRDVWNRRASSTRPSKLTTSPHTGRNRAGEKGGEK